MKILFVCLGNICRSPMAEAIFNKLVEERELVGSFYVDSAGLIDYHEGELPDKRMRSHAAKRGYYLTHRSRPIEMSDFDEFDYIVGMDNANIRSLSNMIINEAHRKKILAMASFLRHYSSASIPDPYYGGSEGFQRVIDLLEDSCASLLDWLLERMERT
ncbi:MAG: low molecular weight protein-tyrosine-phosphatase [Bacteroidaceae bacterium]